MTTEGTADMSPAATVASTPSPVPETGDGAASAPDDIRVELKDVTKRFGAVVACREVSIAVHRGQIHGLLGENGAGKSTLMKVLIGLVPSDGGEIRLRGRPVVVKDPVHAATLGLAMAQQHFSLVERLKVWENVALAHRGKMSRREATRAIGEIGERYGIAAEGNARVEDLTVGQRQRVELVKCLSLKPDVLILDEPTSVLTRTESHELFSVLRQVVELDGLSVILISHKLDEVLQATDVVTIMRDGSVVASLRTAEADAHQLAKAMVGRDVLLQAEMAAVGLLDEEEAAGTQVPVTGAPLADPAAAGGTQGRPLALRLTGISARGPEGTLVLDDLTVEVAEGEILGLAGVDGNGQASIGDVLSGVLPIEAGRIEVCGQEVAARAVELIRAGIGVIPEDRHSSGCILPMSVEENLVAADLDAFGRPGGMLDRKAIRTRALELIERFDISCSSPKVPMSALSGGNQQRVVLARELSRSPKVVIAVQPTRGLDVGAIEYISEQLRASASKGVGIMLISSELDELLALAHRIAVIHSGRIVGEMPRGRIDVERLGLLMGGRVA